MLIIIYTDLFKDDNKQTDDAVSPQSSQLIQTRISNINMADRKHDSLARYCLKFGKVVKSTLNLHQT